MPEELFQNEYWHIKYLAGVESLFLKDDLQVLSHSLWIEALDSAGLQLEDVRLEVLEPIAEEHSVGCVNPLEAVLREKYAMDVKDDKKENRTKG